MNKKITIILFILFLFFSCTNITEIDPNSEDNNSEDNNNGNTEINHFEEYNYPEPTIYVGPTREYKTPAEAAAIASNGDVIEIDPGTYQDTAIWRADNLIIKGRAGGRIHINADGIYIPNRKAIWVITGNNTIVDNIEFSNAAVADRNGAGIRQEGDNLTVRNCYFHHNEMGILAGNNADSEIIVEHSEFSYHGKSNGGFSHNIYVNHIKKFIFRCNYTHHAEIGHTIKSRAYENYILFNRIMDEAEGYSSYLIDLPNGGLSYIVGNIVHQGSNAENTTMLTYAEEGANNPIQELYVCNNTFVNDRSNGRGIRIVGTPAAVKIVNNIFDGFATAVVNGTGEYVNNLETTDAGFRNRNNYDYHLLAGSQAINNGNNNVMVDGESIIPQWEYVNNCGKKERVNIGVIDIGAFELQ